MNRVALYPYALALREPLNLMGKRMTERRGFLLRLREENSDALGIGEVAPFPGLHAESLADAAGQIHGIVPRIEGVVLPDSLEMVEDFVQAFPDLYPSVLFGLEGALLDRLARKQNRSFAALFTPNPRTEIPVNTLIAGVSGNPREMAREVLASGCRAVKIKVARGAVATEVAFLHALRRELPPTVALRLDANRRWSFDEARSFAESLGDLAIEYLEEPLQDSSLLPQFAQMTGLPVAWDETLDEAAFPGLEVFPGLAAIVIKPSRVGGFLKTRQWVNLALARGVKPVISCAFLSGVGFRMVASLAAALIPPSIPCGLGTFTFFKEDLLTRPITLHQGNLSPEQLWEAEILPRVWQQAGAGNL